MKKSLRKLFSVIAIASAIFIIGGIGGVFFEQFVLPRIKASENFENWDFLRNASENVTIINRTERVEVKEDDSVNKISSRPSNSVVNIISVASNQLSKRVDAQSQLSMSGTGVVVTSDGIIVTYRDAIFEENAEYKVLLYNGESYDGELMEIDEFSNLAFIKINANNLTTVDFANSDDFKPGRKLVAIGNTFGEYQNRFSAGLLSNINKTFNLSGKTVASTDKLEGVFETDFDNQSKYLGGPLISYNGELVGIIGMMQIDNEKRYFQIPSNQVRESMDMVINGELEKRTNFGAYYIPITKEYALAHDLERDRGALIYSPSGVQGLAVIDDSPAQKSGLLIGDIVISVAGQEVNLDNPFSNLLNEHLGDSENVELRILRNGKELTLTL